MLWPLPTMATATPRRLSNQRVMLAISGAKVVALPKSPNMTPWAK